MVIGDLSSREESGLWHKYIGPAPNKNARIGRNRTKKIIPNLYKCQKCNYIFDYENWEQPPKLQDSPFDDNTFRCFNCSKKVKSNRLNLDDLFQKEDCRSSCYNGCRRTSSMYHDYFAVAGKVYCKHSNLYQELCECCHCGYVYDYTNWKQNGEIDDYDKIAGIITNQVFLTCPLCRQKNVLYIGRSYDSTHQPNPEA